MQNGDFMRATVEFTVPNASNPAVMVWDYRVTVATVDFNLIDVGEEITDALIARQYEPLSGYLHPSAVITHIALRAFEFPTDGYDRYGSIWQGTAGGVMLPPFITYSIQLTRNNYAMRNGRKAFPGAIVAAVGTGGLMASSVVAAFEVVTDAWAETSMVVEIDDLDLAFEPVIVRVPTTPDTNPTVFSIIPSYGSVKFGTQNSRKDF